MKKIFACIFGLFLSNLLYAQSPDKTTGSYSLQEAIDYALQNNLTIQNSALDTKLANAKKSEVLAAGLPQINANADLLHNIQVQNTILENNPGSRFYDSTKTKGSIQHFQLALPNQFIPTVTATQVLFDKAFFTSLKGANVGRELSEKNLMSSKIEVAYAVSRAYYAVLVNDKQQAYLNQNLARLDSSYRERKAQYNTGLARKIDVDRAEVNLNNLKEEKNKVVRNIAYSKAYLAYLMNIDENVEINLKDSLGEEMLKEVFAIDESQKVDYNNRIEYSILQTQVYINKLDEKYAKSMRYPRLLAIGNFGYNPAATNIGDITQGSRWIYYSYVGLRLQVPIFNGLITHARVNQRQIEGRKLQNSQIQLQKRIGVEADQALINLQNSLESLKTQKRNMQLAEENLKLVKAETEQGISLDLDVVVGEAALKDAQTNYYNALYNSLLSKTDYDKATGSLLKK